MAVEGIWETEQPASVATAPAIAASRAVRGRDDWSVHLFDAGRNLRIQLDVWRRMVGISVDGKPMEDFHPITRVSAAG